MTKVSNYLKNSLLLVISCLAVLLLAEFLVRIFLPQDRMTTWLEMHDTGYMMNQSGGSAFQEFDDRKVEYRFNSNRLRGKEIEESPINILAIGDSYTFGLLLEEEDTFVYQLQEKANQAYPDSIQFLNGGIGGSGLADWPLWLNGQESEFRVNYLIYFMNYDDINRALSKNLFIYQEPDSLVKSQRWKQRPFSKKLSKKSWYRWLQTESDLANIIVKVLWKHVYFRDLTHNFNPNKSEVSIPSLTSFEKGSEYPVNLTYEILDGMDYWCDLNNCEFLIINTGFFEEDKMSMYDLNFYNLLKEQEQETEGPYFDNSECIKDKVDGNLEVLRIPGDSHPNENGAQIIADCTWEILTNTFH